VVNNDILILREGDRVPADAVILESVNLMTDESMLTGESVTVSKSAWDGVADIEHQTPGGDNLWLVYSGTLVTRGHGVARAIATGQRTAMGKIGKSLQSIEESEPLLKKKHRTWSAFWINWHWFV